MFLKTAKIRRFNASWLRSLFLYSYSCQSASHIHSTWIHWGLTGYIFLVCSISSYLSRGMGARNNQITCSRTPWCADGYSGSCVFVCYFLFYIGVQPINHAVIISGAQQSDSAIHVHISILPRRWPLGGMKVSLGAQITDRRVEEWK